MIPENKPRTISLNNKRLLDDDLLAPTDFWGPGFLLAIILRFLNFAVVPGRVVLQFYCESHSLSSLCKCVSSLRLKSHSWCSQGLLADCPLSSGAGLRRRPV